MMETSKSAIKLFGIFPFDRSGKARWLLSELNVKHDDHWLDREKKEHEGPEYLKINPLGRVPALQIDGQNLFESGAICAYLADHYIDRKMAPPLQSKDRLAYQQWMYFGMTVDSMMSRMMIIEDFPAGAAREEKETALLTEFKDAVEHLNVVLSKQEYLLSSGFSAADIGVGYHLYFCSLWDEFKSLISTSSYVKDYMERLQKREAAIQSKVFSYEG